MYRYRFLIVAAAFVCCSSLAFSQASEEKSANSGGATRGSVSIGMQYLIDGETKPPTIKPSSPTINYPEIALLTGQSGVVELDVMVAATGGVESVTVRKSDDSIFTVAATEGVKQFQFQPATLAGAPVSMAIMMEVKFTTEDEWTALYDGSSTDTAQENADAWAYVGDATLPEMDRTAFQQNLVYPDEAKVSSLQGTVTVRVRVDETGKVVEAEVVGEADPILAAAALEAIKKTPFTPGLEGEPAPMWTMIPVNFTMSHGLASKPSDEAPKETSEAVGSVTKPSFDQAELEKNFIFNGSVDKVTEVKLRVMIDEKGGVKQVLAPDETNVVLANAAVQAVQNTSFTPGMQNGKAIPVWITVELKVKPRNK